MCFYQSPCLVLISFELFMLLFGLVNTILIVIKPNQRRKTWTASRTIWVAMKLCGVLYGEVMFCRRFNIRGKIRKTKPFEKKSFFPLFSSLWLTAELKRTKPVILSCYCTALHFCEKRFGPWFSLSDDQKTALLKKNASFEHKRRLLSGSSPISTI
jgi:hypothetical protein